MPGLSPDGCVLGGPHLSPQAPNTRRSPIDVRHQPWPSLAQAQPHKGRGDKVVRLLGSDVSLVMFQWG